MNIYYELHIRGHCGWCKKAIRLCGEKKLDFLLVDYDNCSPQILSEAKELYGWPTVPIVFEISDGQKSLIGGFTDFEKYIEKKQSIFE